jgi:hypothetical protein
MYKTTTEIRRWVKIGVEKAELMIATGQAEESDCKW